MWNSRPGQNESLRKGPSCPMLQRGPEASAVSAESRSSCFAKLLTWLRTRARIIIRSIALPPPLLAVCSPRSCSSHTLLQGCRKGLQILDDEALVVFGIQPGGNRLEDYVYIGYAMQSICVLLISNRNGPNDVCIAKIPIFAGEFGLSSPTHTQASGCGMAQSIYHVGTTRKHGF